MRITLLICLFVFQWSSPPPRFHQLTDIILSSTSSSRLVITRIYYYYPHCPYAIEVSEWILLYANKYPDHPWDLREPTTAFPSPTLRILHDDSWVNYRGTTEIKNAIITQNYTY
jgi:hypothetical protein